MSELAIHARGVEKTYGKGAVAYRALRGVDFDARVGELVMLVGPSGSGKTTLLSILGCVLTASAGVVRLFDEDISRLKERQLPRLRLAYIGFIFQGHNLIASLDARDNVALPMRMRGWGAREAREEAERLLVRVGLEDKIDRLAAELSGGQRQRVAIARAVAGSPPILLCDEPTASLDAETGAATSELLKEMAVERGHTVVIVTHDSRIFHLADRIVRIEDGQIEDGRILNEGADGAATAHETRP